MSEQSSEIVSPQEAVNRARDPERWLRVEVRAGDGVLVTTSNVCPLCYGMVPANQVGVGVDFLNGHIDFHADQLRLLGLRMDDGG